MMSCVLSDQNEEWLFYQLVSRPEVPAAISGSGIQHSFESAITSAFSKDLLLLPGQVASWSLAIPL